MNTSGDRLRVLLRECHLSATDFAANRKVTPQHVNNWFKRGIPMARLEEVAELLTVNSRWLRTGEGPKHPIEPANESDGGEPADSLQDHLPPGANVAVPVFREARGGPNKAAHPPFEATGQTIHLPLQALQALNIATKDVICLSMTGNSMADRLQAGSLLGIDRSTTQVIDGEIYAVEHGGLLRIRYLYRQPNGGLRLRSHNRDEYPDESFSAEQIARQPLRILGWVFWWSTLNQRKSAPSSC